MNSAQSQEQQVIEALRSPFHLAEEFLLSYADQEVEWGPVGYVVYKRTYARYQDPEAGGAFRLTQPGETEEWWQTVARVVEGTYEIQRRHCQQQGVRWDARKAQRSAQRMYQLIFDFKFTPPGRGLSMMGTPYIERHGSAALNNCAYVSTENIDADFSGPFTFLMDMSMLGVGVGSDTRGAGAIDIVEPERTAEAHVIPDEREGWIEALRIVLEAYVGSGSIPVFDYSKVRPAGARIRGFGGTAGGSAPLRRLLEVELPLILDPLVGKPVTGEAIVDIHNVVGKCVVSGNVRRSAEIMFGDPDDLTFLRLKDPEVAGDKMQGEGSWRWASNNSVFAKVGMDYVTAAGFTARAGEPGYFWLDNARDYGRMGDPPNYVDQRAMGGNPCLEQTLESYELCCLVETYPAHHASYAEYEETLKYAYLYAKTVTLLATHDQRTNRVMRRNMRIGLSQSGIMQNVARIGWRAHLEWCDRGYAEVKRWDRIYSEWFCVRESIKVTSVKPSGTVSKLCGATAGIHAPIGEYYILRIRFAKTSDLLAPLQAAGYPQVPCANNPETTVIVEFPVREENFYKAESEIPMWEQLTAAVQIQRWWADNQVSCTVKFDPETEGEHIASALALCEDGLKGISFLPHTHGYVQAPQEVITREEYERRAAAVTPPDFRGNTAEVVDRFCDGAACEIQPR